MPTPICILAVLVVASTANAESDSRLDKQTLSMADVAAIMSDRLSKIPEISDVTFDGDSVLHIRLKNKDEITANLANLLMELNNDPTGREDTIEKYLSTFSTEANSNGGEADVDSLHENLVPVIRGGDYEQSVQQMIGDKESPKFFRKHIVGDYWLYLALDLPQSLSIQTAKDLSILKLSADQMLLLANKNFLRKFGDEIQISEGNGVRMVRIDGSYEASLIAVDSFWNAQASQLGDQIFVMAPARDLLMFCSLKDEKAVKLIQNVVQENMGKMNYIISDKPIVWTHNGWREWTP